MNKEEKRGGLTILEAVDYLSNLAELDQKKAATHSLDEQGKTEELVKEAFRTVHNYLRRMYETDKNHLKEPEMQRGIQAMMVLAGEAATNLDRYTTLFKGAAGTQLAEYKDLQQFYLTKIIKRFQESLQMEEAWQKEWVGLEGAALDVEKRGLRDLENVRRDGDYELFYLRKEDGNPFFNRSLLRHIRLVGSFDEVVATPEGDDLLTRIKILQDKEIHLSAKKILKTLMPHIDEFYKEAMRHKEVEFVSFLNKALMALMLAANPRNLLQNVVGKSCFAYFADFQSFLREALRSPQYEKFLSSSPSGNGSFLHVALGLSHALCSYFFLRQAHQEGMLHLIHQFIARGQTDQAGIKRAKTTLSFWDDLLDKDEAIRSAFKRYPNGPILNVLDAFRHGEEREGFDPLLQHNFPSELYSIAYDEVDANCLRLPSPTKQEVINKAEVTEEFKGFLQFLRTGMKAQRHLLISLQDRTSWKEHARATVLEELQKTQEFSSCLTVISLPKNTDFYFQSEDYVDSDDAQHFLLQFREQIASGQECGFYFPIHLKTKEMDLFIDDAFTLVHKQFFGNRKKLERKERLDFIEIVYNMLVIKWIDLLQPGTFSFTCKDALDTGAVASAGFFAFLRLLTDSSTWSNEERDCMLWMLYAPAMGVRERAVDHHRLNRIFSALVTIQVALDTHRKEILSSLSKLYKKDLFSSLNLSFS